MTELYPNIEPYDHGTLHTGDGHQVYWETCGNPAGKPALVFHGGPGSGCLRAWRLFDPKRYRVVLFDQRGAGRSTPHASIGTTTGREIDWITRGVGVFFPEPWALFREGVPEGDRAGSLGTPTIAF